MPAERSQGPVKTAPRAPLPPDTTAISTLDETYRRNVELAETNKTLMLLRKIDEAVMESVMDMATVVTSVATTIAEESGFPFAALYLRDKGQKLQPQSVVTRIGEPEVQNKIQMLLTSKAISLKHPTSPLARAARDSLIVSTLQLFEVIQPALSIEEAEEAQRRLSLASFYICPLRVRRELIGVLVLGSPEMPDDLGFYQKNLMERLAVAVGLALSSTLLYAEVRAQASTLKAANRHLRELDRAKDEFIAVASHQLRTPLTNVKDYISMLMEGDAGPVSQQQRVFLERAYGGTERMVRLVADLLNVSQMVAGKYFIHSQPADLSNIASEETSQLRHFATAKHIDLVFSPPKKPLPPLRFDVDKTRQVIVNFIDNAIHYTSEGRVDVSVQPVESGVEFKVSDTGIGVPKSAQQRLFSKFFRASNARRLRPDGTGMGLFMAKQVIESQGGEVIYENLREGGSVFGFRLPLKRRRK